MTDFLAWQISVLEWIQQFKHPVLDTFFTWVTMTGEETFYILIAAWLLWCHDKWLAYRVGFAFLSSTVVNPTLKSLFAIDRPIGVEGVESLRTHTAEGYSFPSGHTQSAATFWTALAIAFRQKWVLTLAITMMALVAFSRLYLGVHWLTDVVVGLAVGIAWVLFVNVVFTYAQTNDKLWLLWILILPFVAALVLYPENRPLIVSFGASIGFLAGLQLEQRFLLFSPRAKPWQQLVKLLLGLAVLLALKAGLKPILPFAAPYADLVRYACVGLWLTFGAPLLFTQLKLKR